MHLIPIKTCRYATPVFTKSEEHFRSIGSDSVTSRERIFGNIIIDLFTQHFHCQIHCCWALRRGQSRRIFTLLWFGFKEGQTFVSTIRARLSRPISLTTLDFAANLRNDGYLFVCQEKEIFILKTNVKIVGELIYSERSNQFSPV